MSWLAQDLRIHRRKLLRDRGRELGAGLVAFLCSGALLVLGVHRWPWAVGLVVGAYAGVLGTGGLFLLPLADGTLLPRLGRWLEDEVGRDLRATSGLHAVISGVSFAHRDVDHVVLAPAGCFALEVKASFGRRQTLSTVRGLDAAIRQARDGARLVERLLASRGARVAVRPVLVLTGPGSPRMEGHHLQHDVLVVALTDGASWRRLLADSGAPLDETVAAEVAAALLAYQAQRTAYEIAAADANRHR